MKALSVHETRQLNMRKLIKDRFGNSQSALAKAIYRPPSMVSQWLCGYRNIGEKIARHIEQCLCMQAESLDVPAETSTEHPKANKARRALSSEQLAESDRLKTEYQSAKARLKTQGISLTYEKIGLDLGWSSAAAGQYINGFIPLNIEAAIRFANYFGTPLTKISPRFALMIASVNHHENEDVRSQEPPQALSAPLLTWELESPAGNPKRVPCGIPSCGALFAMRVRGQSMYNPKSRPSFEDGDTIFVDSGLDATHQSIVIGMEQGATEATFRQLIVEGNRRYLQALNSDWPERIIEMKADFNIAGVVCGKLETY